MPDPVAVAAPTCLAIVLCDNIVQDAETKKYYLLGTTNETYAAAFPARHLLLCLYVAVTGIHQRTAITVKQVHVDPESHEDRDVLSIEAAVDAPDPLAIAEVTFKLRNVVFPRAGEYRFQLWSNSTFLGERRLVVRQPSSPPQKA